MKKIILIISIIFITSACTNINEMDYKDNINNTIKYNETVKYYNHNGNGYKYYLPKSMSIKNILNFNEEIISNEYTYYLYIDIISYYNKTNIKGNTCDINYEFENKKKNGYLCINKSNNDNLVEIVYNYAKIEVKVKDIDLNKSINDAIIILSTIKYDDDIIKNEIGENKLGSTEEKLNIFGDKKSDEDFIEVIEEYDTYDESDIPDYDHIN